MQFLAANVIRGLQPAGDTDIVDRLNSYYTVILLVICTLVVTTKQYAVKPIQCWIPPQFTRSMEEYIESYCFAQNTYWIPLHEHIPDDLEAREQQQIGYYQWTAFILAFEALMFYIPQAIWRLLNWQSGINVEYIVLMARDSQGLDADGKQKSFAAITQCVDDVLNLRILTKQNQTGGCFSRLLNFRCLQFCYVSVLRIAIKFLYTFNVSLQLFLLNLFLKGKEHGLYGLEVLSDLLSNREWTQSGNFPRVTLCDFEVKFVGNLNRYTVQCALVSNLFNEKIFVFLWCWFLLLATVTACSFVHCLFNTVIPTRRFEFVAKYLKLTPKREAEPMDNTTIERTKSILTEPKFYCSSINRKVTVRTLAHAVGDVICMEVCKQLWKRYRQRKIYNLTNSVESDKETEINGDNIIL